MSSTGLSSELESCLSVGAMQLLRCLAPIAAPTVSDVMAWLGPDRVRHSALQTIVNQIANLAMPVLVTEIQLERRRNPPAGHSPTERLMKLAERISRPEHRGRIIETYPVLARRVALVADQWRSALRELWTRVEADRTMLATTFGAEGDVTELQLDLGDPHRHGRAVAAICFESGTRLVYKPRSLAVERQIQLFLGNLRDVHDLDLHSRLIVNRGNYGWDSWVEQGTTVQADVGDYFRRVGTLLAVLFPLRVRDLHCSNLVTSGNWPVLLDGESILGPDLWHPSPRLDLTSAILASGALPGAASPDVSALGVVDDRPIATGTPLLVAADTDEIRIEHNADVAPNIRSLPKVNDRCISVRPWLNHLLEGFDTGYEVALANKATWHRFADDCASDEVRVIVHPTRPYAGLLLASTDPAAMTDALELDSIFDHLALLPSVGMVGMNAGLIGSERGQLHDLDVPIFTATVGGDVVTGGDGTTVKGLVKRTGLVATHHHINSLSIKDLRRQRHFIEASLTATAATPITIRHLRPSTGESSAHAREIGEFLCDVSVPGADGRTWLRPSSGADDRVQFEPVSLDLYDGQAGIVLFLAELAHELRDAHVLKVAHEGTQELLNRVDSAELSAGAWGGSAGIAYVLARLADLWSDPTLLTASRRLLRRAARRIGVGDPCCLMSGAAGLAVVASHLNRQTPGPSNSTAVKLGRRAIIRAASFDNQGNVSWPAADHDHQTVTGLAHGLAGIAWGLLAQGPDDHLERQLEASGRKLGLRVNRAERQRFSSASGVHGEIATPETTNSWCHGRPGVAVARSATMATTSWSDAEAAELSAEIERAVTWTLAAPQPDTDGLCHGSLGVYQCVQIVGELQHRQDWIDEAVARTRAVVARASAAGWRLAAPSATPPFGLMTGVSGIGHALLRITDSPPPPVLALSLTPHHPAQRRNQL
jgi:type 2 lantibiotic biosynthesis protein LanM